MSQDKIRVALLFGGRSGEHAISAATAAGVMKAIDREKYDVIPVGITRDGRWVTASGEPSDWELRADRLPEVTSASGAEVVLSSSATGGSRLDVLEPGTVPAVLSQVDVVFPVLHGPFGEDGTVQGLLELADARYVGCGVLASAVGMDKQYMKLVLAAHGLPVGPHVVVTARDWTQRRAEVIDRVGTLRLPLFVKPARAGSSLGVTRVDDLADLERAVEDAQAHDPKVIVEPAEVAERVRELAVRTFEAIGAEGIARVDVFVTPQGDVVVNEINTMPGFTPISMYPRMWAASGLAYPDLIDELIQLALERPTGLR
jgi:D-alanine-D-alanine ligase